MPDHRSQTGFTLLEVMVALAVIAFALSAIIQTASVTTANTAHLQQKTYAHWVALNRTNELRVMKAWLSTGSHNEDIEAFGQQWQTTETVEETGYDNLRRVKIAVIRADGDEDYPLTTLTGLLLNPQAVKD